MSVNEDGDIFEGWFKNGVGHGRGRKIFSDGSYMEGTYVNGNMNCDNGIFVYTNGTRYEG